MQVKLKVSAKIDGAWKKPGSVVELDDVEASGMIGKKQAERTGSPSVGSGAGADDMIEDLISVDGIDDKLVGDLIDAGYTSIDKLSDARAEDLVAIRGIGAKTAEKIIDSAIDIFNARK